MECLKEFWTLLKRFSQTKKLPELLTAGEYVARFSFHSRDLYSDSKQAKPNLFMPENGIGVFETSVCRKTGVSEARIWELAKIVRRPKSPIARADLNVLVINENKLKAVAAPELELGYPEHAVIVGWPEGEDEKALQKKLAIELANKATIIPLPE
jgi:hypothetical protein